MKTTPRTKNDVVGVDTSHVIDFAAASSVSRCLPSWTIFMSKHHRHASFHLKFFVRQQFWPLLIPSIAILFLTFCPQISQSIQVNTNDHNRPNENPDRTVAKRGPREIQLKSTVPPLPLSVPPSTSASKAADFDEPMQVHTRISCAIFHYHLF